VAPGGLKRSERKKFAAAEAVAGPGANVIAYGDGVGHVRFPEAAMWIVGIFLAVSATIFVSSGKILFPGLLILAFLAALIHPRRGIAVTPSGVLVMRVSLWDARPNQVLFMAPAGSLIPLSPSEVTTKKVRLVIGPERIRLKRRAYDPLVMAAQGMGALRAAAAPQHTTANPGPGWFPDPSGRAEFRYWDGIVWTCHVSRGGVASLDSWEGRVIRKHRLRACRRADQPKLRLEAVALGVLVTGV